MWLWLHLTPAFQRCSARFHGRPSERLLAAACEGQASAPCVHGSQARRPVVTRQPCEEGGPVPSCKLCHEAAWSGPARERRGPSLGMFLCQGASACRHLDSLYPPPAIRKSFQNGRPHFSSFGGETAAVDAGNSPAIPEQLGFHHAASSHLHEGQI